VIFFRVNGTPKPQPRPRATVMRIGGKFTARVYNPMDADDWKGLIKRAAMQRLPAEPIPGPVVCQCQFFMPRPDRLMRRRDPDGPVDCDTKPDLDNLIKAVMDAITQTGLWHDDGQVCDFGESGKWFHAKAGAPHALVWVWPKVPPLVAAQLELEHSKGG